MFGWHGALTAAQTAEIAAAKQVIYDGFQGRGRGRRAARKRPASWSTSSSALPFFATPPHNGFTTACPAEKSGQDEFDFEYGEDFADHIEAFHPTFCKVLVRYNPEGDPRSESATGRSPEATLRLPAHTKAAADSCSNCSFQPRKSQLDQRQRRQEGVRLGASPQLMVQAHRSNSGCRR